MVFGQAGGAGKNSPPLKAYTTASAVLPTGIATSEGSGVEAKGWLTFCLTLMSHLFR